MAIPVARVHLVMAHAALPGLLPTPPRCAMSPLLPLPAPPCAIVVLPNNSPPRPSRADAAARWDAHKTKPAGSPASSSSSSGSQRSLDSKKKIVTRTSSAASSSRADSDERWDAHKTRASWPASSSLASSNKTKTCHGSRRLNGGRVSPSTAERWDAHKNGRCSPSADELDVLDDGVSSTGSNDVELLEKAAQPPPLPLQRRVFYSGPGFITPPEPSMLPKPSFMIRVA
ncbi:unnamed protein product [Urochloa decumbens]|uniref:Uncharacterized protein n=1 Tax=Urochloa decumbens TaxID=240449 RepID=A0ABC9B605_9POAL